MAKMPSQLACGRLCTQAADNLHQAASAGVIAGGKEVLVAQWGVTGTT
jgi:hypothetical protein